MRNRTSTAAQRARLLAALQQGPVDAALARRDLGIEALAMRVMEMRRKGHPILTELRQTKDARGWTRFAAHYKLEKAAAAGGGE